MALWERLAQLEVEVESCSTERLSVDVSTEFTRVTTVVTFKGRDHDGVGEDVTYTAEDHGWFPDVEPTGPTTLGELSSALDGLELFRRAPGMEAAAHYRRWAFESAALDLALRQNGVSLGAALGREYRPVRFVVSTRGDAFAWLAHAPQLELKLDPANDWERSFMERLAATGRVRVLDLKAYYRGTVVDVEPDPELYGAVAELFPESVIEDASLEGACGEVMRGEEVRLSFDAPVHSLADLLALPVQPGWLNVKPSRFATLPRLLECIEHCEGHGIRMYGGGQFELGPGRGQIQALASLFYADGPNDVAPADYNIGDPRPGLPQSPLPAPDAVGFGAPAK
jgi:L-alanine-DL-glutamate epimerase-like enolase superfamily enzyme